MFIGDNDFYYILVELLTHLFYERAIYENLADSLHYRLKR